MDQINEEDGERTATLIRPMTQTTSILLCSGQVIRNIADVVKELVENSLDSGADSIEVICKDYGTAEIVVRDNGVGIDDSNFEFLAKRGCTSKLRTFNDLKSIQTMGFRGEALFSIASISNLEIYTKHQLAATGTRLIFDELGNVIKREKFAVSNGTTVKVKNLFHNMPVRKRAFAENVKKDYLEMVKIITTYALGYLDLNFQCTNYAMNKKIVDIDLKRSNNILSNIRQIFGSKQLTVITPFIKYTIDPEVAQEYALDEQQLQLQDSITIAGYVSNREKTSGRNAADRQYFYVNNRPVYYKKLSKHISSIFKQYNGSQCPFAILQINVPGYQVDINLTPDKRTFHMHVENVLFAIMKSSLVKMYESTAASVPVLNRGSSLDSHQKSLSNEANKDLNTDFDLDIRKRANDGDENGRNVKQFRQNSPELTIEIENGNHESPLKQQVNNCNNFEFGRAVNISPEANEEERPSMAQFMKQFRQPTPNKQKLINNKPSTSKGNLDNFVTVTSRPATSSLEQTQPSKKLSSFLNVVNKVQCSQNAHQLTSSGQLGKGMIEEDTNIEPIECHEEQSKLISQNESIDEEDPEISAFMEDDLNLELFEILDKPLNIQKREKVVEINLEDIQNNYEKELKFVACSEYIGDERFKAHIRPSQNEEAENELRKELKKDAFLSMEVLGQFEKGFILARLGADIFIIDQHATDEKYHYERLHKNVSLKPLLFVKPQILNLPAYQESLILNHLKSFEDIGFKFEVNSSAESGKRVMLKAAPSSGDQVFGREDVDEMVNEICDQGDLPFGYLPSKIKKMLAYRACHTAKRIGDVLTFKEMKNILNNMASLNHPWTCAHGRPTIRHLVNLENISKTFKNIDISLLNPCR